MPRGYSFVRATSTTMRLIALVVAFSVLLQIGFVDCDWSQWGGGNGGVHSRPVYNVQPGVQWSFKQPTASVIKGVINVDDTTGKIIIPNSASSQPLFWVLDKNGTVVYSFNDTNPGSCSGTMAVSNGTLYIVNESSCKLLIFDLNTYALQSTSGDLCNSFGSTSGGPFSGPIFLDNDAIYVPLGNAFGVLSRSDGVTENWFYNFATNDEGSAGQFLTPVYSSYDNTIVFFTTMGYLLKFDKTSNVPMFSRKVNMQSLTYDDAKTYPPVVDPQYGFIYVVARNGYAAKYSSEGVLIWTLSFSPSTILHGVLLIDEYLCVMTNNRFYAIETTTQTATSVLNNQLSIGQVKAQLLYANNVLYATDGIGYLAAYNVTNRLSWKQIWSMNTNAKNIEGAGPSIASDGTIYIGGSSNNAANAIIVSIGCVNGNYLNEQGKCVCPTDTFTYQSKCLTCASGEYFNATAGCVLCGAGFVPNSNQTACEECLENTFSMSGDDTCHPCSEQPDNAQCPAPPSTITPPEPTNNTPGVVRGPDGKPTSGAEARFIGGLALIFSASALITAIII
eukprot:TRINITY_DN2277_c0_g1_i1.p1 TRINITY_DN2277_c0_g1~~TRINITY_DN2277_c0_g1_i1.p1  ORF type:complete len:561 (-),score=92.01 TRINITY_DN2277_c0_g1_i1:43-1725(-)